MQRKLAVFFVLAVVVAFVFSLCSTDGKVEAQSSSSGAISALPAITADPCQNVSVAKSSAPIAVSAAGAVTGELVAASAGKKVFVCQFDFTLGGTSPTAIVKTGTKVTNPCDTTPSNLSGTYTPLVGNEVNTQFSGTNTTSITSGEICLTLAGTNPSAQGLITFVQQ